MGFGVWGLGFGVWGLGFGVWGLGFGVWGSGFRARAFWGFGVQVSGVRSYTESQLMVCPPPRRSGFSLVAQSYSFPFLGVQGSLKM